MSGATPTETRKSASRLVGRQDHETQAFGSVAPTRIVLAEQARREGVENLNQLLADVLTLRDLYKKHHWQASGASFCQLHQLFDKHAGELAELADAVAERVMMLGGVSIAMAADVADTTLIPRPPRGREDTPTQLSRLLHAHEVVLKRARATARLAAEAGDDGTNDLLVGDVIRTNEKHVWFVAEHLVESTPLRSDSPPG